MTYLLTRPQWGALPATGSAGLWLPGWGKILVIHYTGHKGAIGFVEDKADALRKMQNSYQTGGRGDGQRYVDAPYNFNIFNDDDDDRVWELRGLGMRSGANGTAQSNAVEPSCLIYVGTEDAILPSTIQKVKWLTQLIREQSGQMTTHVGHRDRMATACPGAELYHLVKSGAMLPDVGPINTGKEDNEMFMLRKINKAAVWLKVPGGRVWVADEKTFANLAAAIPFVLADEQYNLDQMGGPLGQNPGDI